MNFRPIAIAILIMIAMVVVVIFVILDDNLAKIQMVQGGSFSEEYIVTLASRRGTTLKKYYNFELPNGGIATIPAFSFLEDRGVYKKGDKVKLYYRKGFFTGRPIYDSFLFEKDI